MKYVENQEKPNIAATATNSSQNRGEQSYQKSNFQVFMQPT